MYLKRNTSESMKYTELRTKERKKYQIVFLNSRNSGALTVLLSPSCGVFSLHTKGSGTISLQWVTPITSRGKQKNQISF